MDYLRRLSISYYKTIATLNESHHIYLVQHQDTHKIFVKKILTVYNAEIYVQLSKNPICGIPQVIDYYEEDGHLTVIEQYISGQSLEERMGSSGLEFHTILIYGLELCQILNALHSLQPPIIHRDIKPANVMITEHNHVVLIDFNAAKFYSKTTDSDTVLLGTKGYAAPEQYGFGSSSPKTDLYALGILLKELTSSLPDVPSEFTSIVEKCCQMNPRDRYNTVIELEHALRHVMQSSQPEREASVSCNRILPPGFRTRNPWKMLIAVPGYLSIFELSLALAVENMHGLALWVERFFCLCMFLCIIAGSFNYMDIHKFFPLCRHKNLLVRCFGIVLLDSLMVITCLILMVIVESIFFI